MRSKILSLCMAIVMLGSVLVASSTEVYAKKQKPKLSTTKASISIGQTKKLKVKNLSGKIKISWKSSDTKIATISKKGLVKGKAQGSTTIKATFKQKGKKTVLKCKVNVKSIKNSEEKCPTPLPLSSVEKKNVLFDKLLSNNNLEIHYWINDKEYTVTDSKRILAVLSYLSMLEVSKTDNPKVVGGFSMEIYKSGSKDQKTEIGLLSNKFNIDGTYYEAKNSTVDIVTVIKMFLSL